jgi:hypothetical protein
MTAVLADPDEDALSNHASRHAPERFITSAYRRAVPRTYSAVRGVSDAGHDRRRGRT